MLAHRGASPPGDVSVADYTLGDLLDPYRTASATDVVNLVSRGVGFDAAGWRVSRLLRMGAQIEAEARQRQG